MVTMDDKIAVALRNKRQSSMRLAINLVHEKKADACISAGNTGALMAISRFVLKTHARQSQASHHSQNGCESHSRDEAQEHVAADCVGQVNSGHVATAF